jgi:hypothetical protein
LGSFLSLFDESRRKITAQARKIKYRPPRIIWQITAKTQAFIGKNAIFIDNRKNMCYNSYITVKGESIMVILNIIAQIMFFVINIFILPWLASLVTDKFGSRLPKWIDKPTLIIKSWTVTMLSELLRFPILFLSFNRPEDLDIAVIGGELSVKYNYNSSKYYWYNPIMQIGKYIANAVWILMGPALTILSLALMLPKPSAE